MKQDVYTRVTDTILAALEQGTRPWMQPWNAAHAAGPVSRPLRHNGKPYQGVNVLMLWLAAMEKGYTAPIWMTYNQAKELGAHVKKDERGSLVVYANTFTKTETNEKTGEDEEIEIPYMKPYTVFNVEQIEGLPAHYYARVQPPHLSEAQRHARLDAFFAATKADIRHGGNRAFYAIEPDFIQMPPFESFHSPESYYATLAHEGTHWTRHPSRLARDMGRKKWGDKGYAMEELVAEIGSAFLCAELGLTPDIRDDHAADYLLNLQPAPEPDPEPDAGGPAASATPDAEPERGSEPGPAPAAGEDPPASGPPVPDGPPPGTPGQLSFF